MAGLKTGDSDFDLLKPGQEGEWAPCRDPRATLEHSSAGHVPEPLEQGKPLKSPHLVLAPVDVCLTVRDTCQVRRLGTQMLASVPLPPIVNRHSSPRPLEMCSPAPDTINLPPHPPEGSAQRPLQSFSLQPLVFSSSSRVHFLY